MNTTKPAYGRTLKDATELAVWHANIWDKGAVVVEYAVGGYEAWPLADQDVMLATGCARVVRRYPREDKEGTQ